jgi:hypothetical protein
MNYNDINERLKRIYASIDSKNKYGGEVLTGVHTDHTEMSNGQSKVTFSFGDKVEATNQIHNIIGNLANLKDILKYNIVKQGKGEQLIEDEINKSFALQLILDLSNQEKHGYPLTKTRRSKKDPLIKNICTGLSPSNKPDDKRYSSSDGSAAFNVMIVINADIVDYDENHLFTLDELIKLAINDWENIIAKFQLVTS